MSFILRYYLVTQVTCLGLFWFRILETATLYRVFITNHSDIFLSQEVLFYYAFISTQLSSVSHLEKLIFIKKNFVKNYNFCTNIFVLSGRDWRGRLLDYKDQCSHDTVFTTATARRKVIFHFTWDTSRNIAENKCEILKDCISKVFQAEKVNRKVLVVRIYRLWNCY